MTTTDRSPSPPPQKPVGSTPGPRASQLITRYNGALTSTLKSISYDSFADCFPTIAQQAPSSLKHMHSEFVGRLERFALDEFQTILEERNVITNLNKLDDLIHDATKRKSRASDSDPAPVPAHTLPAPTILEAHLAPIQSSQQSQLNARIQTMQSQNAGLGEEIKAQRREIEELLGLVERVVGDLERAGEKLGEDGEVLAAEARGAEEILSGV